MPGDRLRDHCYEYARPALTADAVVWTFGKSGWRLLLIERKSRPFAGCWALPGGFVNPEEPPLDACMRELAEETSVEISDFRDVGVFGDPARDPRGWTVSNAFYALLPEGVIKAKAGDDASRFGWHPMEALPELAFDHAKIVEAARRRLAADLYTTRIAKPILPRTFTAADAGKLFRTLDKRAPHTGGEVLRRLAAFDLVKRVGEGKWKFR